MLSLNAFVVTKLRAHNAMVGQREKESRAYRAYLSTLVGETVSSGSLIHEDTPEEEKQETPE